MHLKSFTGRKKKTEFKEKTERMTPRLHNTLYINKANNDNV